MADPYDIHPSAELRALFESAEIPYQGHDPQQASVLFVGLDANYSAELFEHPTFRERIFEYHEDGVAFWQRYGVHHPFLLPEYPLRRNQGGVPYHKKFSRMGLTPDLADQISFIELLNVPTTGSTSEARFWELFDIAHARRIDALFQHGTRRLVLLPGSVVAKMQAASRKFGVFEWIPGQVEWGRFHEIGHTEFHKVRHFSGAISLDQLASMGEQVRGFCAATDSPVSSRAMLKR